FLITLVVVVVEPVLHGAGRDGGQVRLDVEALDRLEEVADVLLGMRLADVGDRAGAEDDLAVIVAGAAHAAAAGTADAEAGRAALAGWETGGGEAGKATTVAALDVVCGRAFAGAERAELEPA